MSREGEGTREKSGTFLVMHADRDSAVIRDVNDAEVHTLECSHEFTSGEVLEAIIETESPMNVVWSIVEIEARRPIPVESVSESPTALAVDLAEDQPVGEVTKRERAGKGEFHVLTVPPEKTESAVKDIVDDDETVVRAARLGVDRVEIRAADGVISVRYLP